MVFNAKKLARQLIDSTEDCSADEARNIVAEFVAALAKRNLLATWRKIESAIHLAWKDKYGVSNISLITAHELSDSAKKTLISSAKGANVEIKVHEGLIGGAILRIDDNLVDGSVSGALKRLKQTLIK